MIQYGDFFFFYIMALILLPAIIMGVMGKKIKLYGIIASFFMLALLIGNNLIYVACFVAFYIGQVILIKAYSYLRKKTDSKWLMRLAVGFSILPLVLVKISPYITTTTIGFVGISYITFRVVQIIIDIYDGIIEDVTLMDFTYFAIFFPSLSSGPIDRMERFKSETNSTIEPKNYLNNYLFEGLYRIIKGIGYKFIIAEIINIYWMSKIPEAKTALNIISYAYAYTLYLFFDFAGYSNIAIGTGYILGVRLPENFNMPFLSKNMKEFWNRWHMSLSYWFRDYIYNRFVMDAMKKKRFKSRYTASYVGHLITMLTMGIWHGVKIHYLIYGLYMALVLILTDYVQRKSKLYKKHKKKLWWNIGEIVLNFQVLALGLLIFSGYLYNK